MSSKSSFQKSIIIAALAALVVGGGIAVVYKKKHDAVVEKHEQQVMAVQSGKEVIIGVDHEGEPVTAPASLPRARTEARPVNVIGTYTGAAPVTRENYISSGTTQMLTGNLRLLQQSITAALQTKQITLADLEKLSFGGVDPKVDPNFAVFNPQGKIRFKPMINQWIDQKLRDQLTTQAGMPLIFNLRRLTDASRTTTDILYAILPNPVPQVCIDTKQVLAVNAAFKLEVDNQTIVTDDPGVMPVLRSPACLQTPDKKVFMFYPLRARVWRAGGRQWGSF